MATGSKSKGLPAWLSRSRRAANAEPTASGCTWVTVCGVSLNLWYFFSVPDVSQILSAAVSTTDVKPMFRRDK